MNQVTPSNFNNGWVYKFVIFNDNQVLFCDVNVHHSTLAGCSMQTNQHRPVGAGKIKYSDQKYQIEERGSYSLGIRGCTEMDEQLLDHTLKSYSIELTDEYIY